MVMSQFLTQQSKQWSGHANNSGQIHFAGFYYVYMCMINGHACTTVCLLLSLLEAKVRVSFSTTWSCLVFNKQGLYYHINVIDFF